MKMYVCNRKDLSVAIYALVQDGDDYRLLNMSEGYLEKWKGSREDAIKYLMEMKFVSFSPLA